jgi:hypothetical protein
LYRPSAAARPGPFRPGGAASNAFGEGLLDGLDMGGF